MKKSGRTGLSLGAFDVATAAKAKPKIRNEFFDLIRLEHSPLIIIFSRAESQQKGGQTRPSPRWDTVVSNICGIYLRHFFLPSSIENSICIRIMQIKLKQKKNNFYLERIAATTFGLCLCFRGASFLGLISTLSDLHVTGSWPWMCTANGRTQQSTEHKKTCIRFIKWS